MSIGLRSVLSIALSVLAGCGAREPAAAPSEPATAPSETEAPSGRVTQMIGGVSWTVEVDPPVVTGGAILRITVENPAHQSYHPTMPTVFAIDGEPSHGLNLRFGNGALGPEWQTLETGQRAVIERDIGDLLEVGTHRIEVTIGETVVAVDVERAPPP